MLRGGPLLSPTEQGLLARARHIADTVIAPRANVVDDSTEVPCDNLAELARGGLLGLAVPVQHGGAGASRQALRQFHAILAESCGTTAFVAVQHATACSLVSSARTAGALDLLPGMARGELKGAPAFSHLRQRGTPAVRAEIQGDRVIFDGVAPWVSGWGAVDVVAMGGVLPDGAHLFAAIVVKDTEGVTAWPPMRLAAMSASCTVSLAMSRATVPVDHILTIRTPAETDHVDMNATLNQAPCSLGVAEKAAKLLETRAGADPSLWPTTHALRAEIDSAWAEVERWADQPGAPGQWEHAVQIRARCIDVGVRGALAAIVATGGNALKRDRDAQRLYREALVYAVAPQSVPLRQATLAQLFRT